MTSVAKTKRKRGGQSKYTPEHHAGFCAHVSEGKTAGQYLVDNGISRTALWLWQREYPSFADDLARARELGHDAIADECIKIADEAGGDRLKIEHAKLRIETRLKLLACWDPKRYGQRNTQDNAISVTVNVVDPTAHLVTVGAIDHAPQARLIPQDDQREHTRVAQVSDQAPEQADSRHRTG
jgi:hypothetical protein